MAESAQYFFVKARFAPIRAKTGIFSLFHKNGSFRPLLKDNSIIFHKPIALLIAIQYNGIAR